MTITTEWQVSAETQAEMEVNGHVFADVVTTVHWRCVATDSVTGASETIYGSTIIPAPQNPETYIDVSELLALTPEHRRAAVLGWAEAIQPGMEDGIQAQAIAALEARLAAPAKASVTILP